VSESEGVERKEEIDRVYERGQTSRFLAVISLELSRVLLYYETHFVPVGSLVRREEDICHQSRLDFRQLSLHSLPHTHIYFDCTSIVACQAHSRRRLIYKVLNLRGIQTILLQEVGTEIEEVEAEEHNRMDKRMDQ